MSLVKKSEVVFVISDGFKKSIADIEALFKRQGWTGMIEERFKRKEITRYFNYRLKDGFKEIRDAARIENHKYISSLLDLHNLEQAVKDNVKVYLLMKIKDIPCHELSDYDEEISELFENGIIEDVIYDLEETIDEMLNDCISNSSNIIILGSGENGSEKNMLVSKFLKYE